MNDTKICVLGTEYDISFRMLGGDGADGYCDYTSKNIVIRSDNVSALGDFVANQKKQLRHETIHAFLAESGLQANFEHVNKWGHDETMVDWVAIQFPKLLEAFRAAGCL